MGGWHDMRPGGAAGDHTARRGTLPLPKEQPLLRVQIVVTACGRVHFVSLPQDALRWIGERWRDLLAAAIMLTLDRTGRFRTIWDKTNRWSG